MGNFTGAIKRSDELLRLFNEEGIEACQQEMKKLGYDDPTIAKITMICQSTDSTNIKKTNILDLIPKQF